MMTETKAAEKCALLQSHLDSELTLHETKLFERHLETCSDCSKRLEEWTTIKAKLGVFEETTRRPPGTSNDLARILEREPKSQLSPSRWIWVTASVPAVLVLLLIAFGLPSVTPRTDSNTTGHSPEVAAGESLPPRIQEGDLLEAPETSKEAFELGPDKITLEKSSKARLEVLAGADTSLRLLEGTIACNVSPRRVAGLFSVTAGPFSVTVKGTQFWVTREPGGEVVVYLGRGAVEVSGADGRRWELSPGDSLRLGAEPKQQQLARGSREHQYLDYLLSTRDKFEPAESTVAVEEANAPQEQTSVQVSKRRLRLGEAKRGESAVSTARALVVSGDFKRAEKMLLNHLDAHPDDGHGWMLLADSRRKQKKWSSAARSYERAAANSTRGERSRAQYKAALIYGQKLGQHARAKDLLEKYLKSKTLDGTLRQVAKIDLAKSLIALGQRQRARQILGEIARDEKDSFAGKNANRLLKTINE